MDVVAAALRLTLGRWRRVLGVAALLVLVVTAWTLCMRPRHGPAAADAEGIRAEIVAEGLADPLYLVSPPNDPRLFVAEQAGRIRVIREGRLLPRPYLDLTDRVGSGGERGLLSLAFDPRFRDNGRLYVNYTDRRGDTHVARFRADPEADTADPRSEVTILFVPQPFPNHNGGHVLFGPDGMLYVGMGDGGAAGDPGNNAQDLTSLLGKLLRVDVSAESVYAVPGNNPFAVVPRHRGTVPPAGRATGGPRPEIWAYGLRNPWRIAFDTASGLLIIADVGQNAWEEVNAVPIRAAGLNYGWRHREGRHCYLLPVCRSKGLTQPVFEYGHGDGCSITGGVVYRGRALPQLVGHYLFSDWCTGWIRSIRIADGRAGELRQWIGSLGPVTSFGEDAAGEVYVMSGVGAVYRLVPAR